MRIIDQYKNIKKEALEREYLQVKKYVHSNEINIERSITKYIRRQIFIFKEIRKKAKKYINREDIREYFLSQM